MTPAWSSLASSPLLAAALGLGWSCAGAQAPPKPFNATCAAVEQVSDGDTFRCVRVDGKAFRVRVAAVDAPEMEVQRASESARASLRAVAVDGTRVVCSGAISYGRWVCRAFTPEEKDVGALLLEAGAAWYYTHFAEQVPPKYRLLYGKLQAQARGARRGLWADEDPMPPWRCRTAKQAGQPCR